MLPLFRLGRIQYRARQRQVVGDVVGGIQIELVIGFAVDREAVVQVADDFTTAVVGRAGQELVVLVEHREVRLVLGAARQRRFADPVAIKHDGSQVGVVVGVIGLEAEPRIEGVLRIQLNALRYRVTPVGVGLVALDGHRFAAHHQLLVPDHFDGEVLDVLPEQSDTQHRTRLVIPLQADIELGRLERLQILVAARTVPARIGGAAGDAPVVAVFLAVELEAAGIGDAGVARARNDLRRRGAQHQVVPQVIGDVETGQHVGVGLLQRGQLVGLLAHVATDETGLADGPRGRRAGGTWQRIAVRTVHEVVHEPLDRIGGCGALLGSHDAHADVAAQAIGAEVGLEVARIDLLADVVDEIRFAPVLHAAIAAVEIVDVGREIDARKHVGVEAAGDVADGLGVEKARLGDALLRIVAAAALVSGVIIVRRRALADPVGIAGVAMDLAVAVLRAELDRIQPAILEQLGEVGLEVVLLELGFHPGRVGRTGIDFRHARHQHVLQVRREGRRRRSAQIPGAVGVAGLPYAIDLATRLGRHAEVHRRTAFRPGAAALERRFPEGVDVPLDREIGRLRERLLAAVAAGELRGRNGAVVRSPAAAFQARGHGVVLIAVVGLAGQFFVLGAGDDGAAAVEVQPVEQPAAGPVAVARVAGQIPFRNLQHVQGVVALELEAEIVGGQGQVVRRFELERQLRTLALALLLAHREVDRRRHEEVGVIVAGLVVETRLSPPVMDAVLRLRASVDVHRGRGVVVVAVPLVVLGGHFHAAVGALLFGHAHQDAETIVIAVPGIHRRQLRVGGLAGVGVRAFGRGETRVAFHVQRAPRMQDHGAADAAFVDARFRRLEQFRAGQHVGRQQRVVERARGFVVGFGRGDVVAVQLGQGEVGGQAAHADGFSLAAIAGDDHAGHALQRIGDVLVGEFADVFGGDDLDDRVGVALLFQALLDRVAIAGDRDLVQVGGAGRAGLLRGRRCLLRGRHARQRGGCGQCDGDRGGQRVPDALA